MAATPFTTLGLAPSFGFGDRIGLATPGHIQAMRRSGFGIAPIFAQQSIREMTRTRRAADQVVADAIRGIRDAKWAEPSGADADHLKTQADVDVTVSAGFTFFTIDPSGEVDARADSYDLSTLRTRFATVAGEVPWIQSYRGQTIELASGTAVRLDETACQRAAVKYGRAVNQAVELAKHIARQNEAAPRDFEIELSIDETEQPTTLAEHYIIAHRCLNEGMKLVSLAPRFIGDFEKGVDYKGDLLALERSLVDHAAIASLLGPYKLSLHSGSDKLSMYAALAKATSGRFHVKTAGTSYLEALRVVARHEPRLLREIITFARGRYDIDKATYHVSAALADIPPPEQISRATDLESLYLECWRDVPAGQGFMAPGRQLLHCTFGSVLTSEKFGPILHDLLATHQATYTEVLADHFSRHLEALRAGM